MIGETIGAYTIVSELGRGGVGVVYLAEHRHLHRKVAIKFLQAKFGDRADLVQRFFTEARAASVIEHEGIVRVLDCDVHSTGNPYIVMEYLVGDTIREYLARRGRLGVPEAAAIIIRVADALAAAHAMGIVHRDLKPDNVFVLAQPLGAVKLVDFGIAKLTHPAGSPLTTLAGMVMGTPRYMSPEQARGTGAVDGRSDVYSLGCLLYELLCGRPPFVYDDAETLLAAHLSEVPVSAHALEPSVPGSLSSLVDKMLAKLPDQRPGLVDGVIPALAAVLTGRTTVINSPTGMSTPPGGRRRATVLILSIVAAAGVAAALWFFRGQGQPAATFDPIMKPLSSPTAMPTTPPPAPGSPPSHAAAPPAEPPITKHSRPRKPALAGPSHDERTVHISLTSEPTGAVVCVPGNSSRVGLTNDALAFPASPEPLTLLLYRRGFHVEKVVLPSSKDARKTVKLRPLAEDDLQPPPPCR